MEIEKKEMARQYHRAHVSLKLSVEFLDNLHLIYLLNEVKRMHYEQ